MVRINVLQHDQVQRLERAGFAVHRAVEELRELGSAVPCPGAGRARAAPAGPRGGGPGPRRPGGGGAPPARGGVTATVGVPR